MYYFPHQKTSGFIFAHQGGCKWILDWIRTPFLRRLRAPVFPSIFV